MDVWRLTVAVLRRWYVLLPLLALTGYAALQAGEGIRPEYEVSATAMVVPGQAGSEIANPYGGLDDANQIVSIVLSSNEAREQIAAAGLNPTYEVSAASRSTIMSLTVRDASAEGGVATLEAVLDAAASELSARQDAGGIAVDAQYGIDTLAAPAVSAVVQDGKTRIMAIVGVLGAAVAFLLAVLFDDLIGLIKRWRRKRRDRHGKRSASMKAGASGEPSGSDRPQADEAEGEDAAAQGASSTGDADAEAAHDSAEERRLARAGQDG